VKLFLRYWFFYLAITNLRAKRSSREADYGFSYHFSGNGELVSLESQISFRDDISEQCHRIANLFVPYLLKSMKKSSPSHAAKKLAEGLLNTLGFEPPQSPVEQEAARPCLNVVVGSRPRRTLEIDYDLSDNLIRILPYGQNRNVSFNLALLESFVGHEFHTLVKDLLEIGFIVYMADLYIERQPNLARRIDVLIPVRHLKAWQQVEPQLDVLSLSWVGMM